MTTATTNPFTDHRVDHWEFIERHGAPIRRGRLLRLRDHWADLNAEFYGGAMVPPVILLTPPGGSRVFGDTREVGSYGEPMEIRLRPSLLNGTHPQVHGDPEGCYRFTADVLMHEMIHQWQTEITRELEGSYHGHGPGFAAKANEIGAALGLPAVVARNRKGSTLPVCGQWPHNVRPLDYYLGAYDPDGSTPDPGDEAVTDPPGMIRCPHCRGRGEVPNPGS